MFDNYDYMPTDLEDEIFLSEVPLELLEQSIKTQFESPAEYRKKDYVQTFITNYNYSVENLEDMINTDEVDREELERLRLDFVGFMTKMFDAYLGVGIDTDALDDDDTNNMILLVYGFFIKNIKKNFVSLIMNYMEEHKKEIVEDLPKRKDVTTLNFKNEIDNDDDVAILSNLSDIIDDILSMELTVDEFMKLVQPKSCSLEYEFVKEHLDDFTITGNFVPYYTKMVDEHFKTELESKIRNKILKKYPKRESKKKEN